MRLTVKERILLHLLEFTKYANAFEAPSEVTQEGVARRAGIAVPHLTQYVRPMVHEGLVHERTAHVKESPRRRKVYDLTDAGKLAAIQLREKAKAETVRIRDVAGVREATVAQVLQEAGATTSVLDVVRQHMDSGLVDLAALAAQSPVAAQGRAFVERLADAPQLVHFVGRRAELDRLTGKSNGTRVFVVRGVAGIGKSCLAAKACQLLRGARNLFWHRVRPWDTRQSILGNLAEFLSSVGRPALQSNLARGQSSRVDDVLRQDLPGTQAFLVFDDAHEATPEVLAFFGFLRDVIATAGDAQMLVLTRRKLSFYDRRHVVLGGLVGEIDLEGLGVEEIAAFMSSGGEAPELVDLGRQLGGHPLSLELLRFASTAGAPHRVLRDVHRFIEEEIYADLSEREREVMKTVSLYRVPVPLEVLLTGPGISHDVLLSLQGRALLRRLGDDSFEVHDTIRDFFASVLTPAEKETLGAFVASQLQRLAAEAQRSGALVKCIDCVSNALELLPAGHDDAALLETLGDALNRIGDLPAALRAYRRPLQASTAAENRARLHRKIAAMLEERGDVASAASEIEAGFEALGETLSAERGWLDLILSRIAYRLVDWDRAGNHGESALETFRSFGIVPGQAKALLVLGYIAMHSPQNAPGLAERYLREAVSLSESIEEIESAADIRLALAHLLSWHLGEVERGMDQIAAIERIPGAMELPHVRREFLLSRATSALEFFADYDAAEANFRQALDEAQRIQDTTTVANAKTGLAYVAYFRGRLTEARRGFKEASAELKAQGLIVDAVNNLLALAESSFLDGDIEALGQIMASLHDPELAAAVEARMIFVRLAEGYFLLAEGDREASYAALLDAIRRGEAQASASATSLTFGFVACINNLAVYAHFYSGVALRFMGLKDEGEAYVAKAKETLETYRLKARLEMVPVLERRLTEILENAART